MVTPDLHKKNVLFKMNKCYSLMYRVTQSHLQLQNDCLFILEYTQPLHAIECVCKQLQALSL